MESLADLLACPVCLDDYDRETRRPKAFPCQHAVCLFCVEQMLEKVYDEDDGLQCPQCRMTVAVGEDQANALPDSLYVKQLLDVRAIEEQRMKQKDIKTKLNADMSVVNVVKENLTRALELGRRNVDDIRQHAEITRSEVDLEMNELIQTVQARRKQLHRSIDRAVADMEAIRVAAVENSLKSLQVTNEMARKLIEQERVEDEEYKSYSDHCEELNLPAGPTQAWNEHERVVAVLGGRCTVDTIKRYGEIKTHTLAPCFTSKNRGADLKVLALSPLMTMLRNDRVAVKHARAISVRDQDFGKVAHFRVPEMEEANYYYPAEFQTTCIRGIKKGILALHRDEDILLLNPDGAEKKIQVDCTYMDADWRSDLIYAITVDKERKIFHVVTYRDSGEEVESRDIPLPPEDADVFRRRGKTMIGTQTGGDILMVLNFCFYIVRGNKFELLFDGWPVFQDKGISYFQAWNDLLFIVDGAEKRLCILDLTGDVLRIVNLGDHDADGDDHTPRDQNVIITSQLTIFGKRFKLFI